MNGLVHWTKTSTSRVGVGGELLQRVQQGRLRAGQVAGDVGGSLDHLGAGGAASAISIVGATKLASMTAFGGRRDGPGDQWDPADAAQVLARHPLGAAAGGDDRDHARRGRGIHARTVRSGVTRR